MGNKGKRGRKVGISIILLSLFALVKSFISFLECLVLYIFCLTFLFYWDFGKYAKNHYRSVRHKKKKTILYVILFSSPIFSITELLLFLDLITYLVLFEDSIRVFGFGVYLVGIFLMYYSRYFCLKQSWRSCSIVSDEKLIVDGVYKVCRHPIYFASFLVYIGLGIFQATIWSLLVGFGIVICYYFLGKIEEEQLLESNPHYRKYLDKTPYTPLGYLFRAIRRS